VTQLPPPQRRTSVPQHAKRLRPKTYSVAVYLVGAVVLLQIVMVISIFWLRAMVVPVNFKLPVALTQKSGTSAASHPYISPSATNAGLTAPKPLNLPNLPSLSMSMPHPALLSVPTVSDTLEQISSLNDQAKLFQRQNDLKSAMDTLVKAEDLDPRNPNTLKNLAETAYLLNDSVQAKIYWQRLVDLGPGVGTVYALAKDHVLLLGSTPDADPLREASTLSRLIYIDDTQKTQVETSNGQPQFHLRTVLMRKNPKMPSFDQKKLRPYVIFYQQMPDGKLVPDLNQHGGAFEDTFLFWGNKNHESFGVDYIMPIPGMLGPNNTPQGEYYGFIIGIYYNNTLQDARSEPTDLLTRMPLPDEIE
jgi:hypothetical protein